MISDPQLQWWTQFLLRITAAIAVGAAAILLMDSTADAMAPDQRAEMVESAQDMSPAIR